MDKLLAAVLDAHGGLQNWSNVTSITAEMSLGGVFWAARGWPDVYSKQTVTLDPHREHITFAPFTAKDRSRHDGACSRMTPRGSQTRHSRLSRSTCPM
jgi:hypothetical protein